MDGGIIEVGGVEYPVACNAFTPIAYSREFFVERKDGSRPKDINEAISVVLDVSAASNIPPIVPLLEIFYACAKTYNATAKEKTGVLASPLRIGFAASRNRNSTLSAKAVGHLT